MKRASKRAAAQQPGGFRALLDQLEQRLRDLTERVVSTARARVARTMPGSRPVRTDREAVQLWTAPEKLLEALVDLLCESFHADVVASAGSARSRPGDVAAATRP